MMDNIKIVISDLDGTLLPNNGKISLDDLETLYSLKAKGIVRVIATGRSLNSAQKALKSDFPIDYLIFSSGAGIMKWDSKKIIFSSYIKSEKVNDIALILLKENIDYMIHKPIPNNHEFWYHRTGNLNPDFIRRLNLYKQYATPIGNIEDNNQNACQLLAILPNNLELFEKLSTKVDGLKVIRATSPLDNESIWMEIFPSNISKASGAEFICQKLNIKAHNAIAIGNDYNDIDLLDWSKYSYVVANAPLALRNKYSTSLSVDQSGFSHAIQEVDKYQEETSL